MNRSNLILSTSPLSLTARKPRGTVSLAHRQRLLYGRKRRHSTVKELDTETGLYYYGARYLDSKTSRWLSGDPAVGGYVPEAPVDDEARKRNGRLPGMGGVFNYVNLHVYHYAGNNPVKYTDPDGRTPASVALQSLIPYIERYGPQIVAGIKALGITIATWAALAVGKKIGNAMAESNVASSEQPNINSEENAGQNITDRAQAATPAPSQPPQNDNDDDKRLDSNHETGGRENYREKTRGANANDKQQIDNIAREAGIDRKRFGKFIHEIKKIEGRGPTDNYRYDELCDLAKQFKELQ